MSQDGYLEQGPPEPAGSDTRSLWPQPELLATVSASSQCGAWLHYQALLLPGLGLTRGKGCTCQQVMVGCWCAGDPVELWAPCGSSTRWCGASKDSSC